MSVPGTWNLNYDWGCTGHYTQVPITFDANGTFAIPAQKLHGQWSSHDGQILFEFDGQTGPRTCYGGTVVENAMVGISSTFGKGNGCWYAIRTTVTVKTLEDQKPKHSAAGDPVK